MNRFIIQGGKPLFGKVKIGGAKNASYKLIIASLLTDQKVTLKNIANIGDVVITRAVAQSLGAKTKASNNTLTIESQHLSNFKVEEKIGQKSRCSTVFAAPLLVRFGKAQVPFPGGDKIGCRPIDRHLRGLKSLNIDFCQKGINYFLQTKGIIGSNYRFEKNTHTGTETLIMVASLAKGETLLKNASQEPEVDELITFLNKMGGKIKRVAPRTIKIIGVKKLHGTTHTLMPDRNEAVSFAVAALATKGDIFIENIKAGPLTAFLRKVKEAGGGYEIKNHGLRFFYQQPLRSCNITTSPHPGFMTDWQPLWTTLMTQAQGKSKIVERIHNFRFHFVADLKKMGAKITLFNPKVQNPDRFYNFNLFDDKKEYFHAAEVSGPSLLKPIKTKVSDIRAGATLVLAALIAKGKSTLSDIYHIDRGYEHLDLKLKKLGANIKRA
jgi:UDP-N-acetylglucosamine 1-carboxyvinyltransferase